MTCLQSFVDTLIGEVMGRIFPLRLTAVSRHQTHSSFTTVRPPASSEFPSLLHFSPKACTILLHGQSEVVLIDQNLAGAMSVVRFLICTFVKNGSYHWLSLEDGPLSLAMSF